MNLEQLLPPELYTQVKTEIDKHNAAEPDKSKQVRFVDLGEGGYVSASKYNDNVNRLTSQVTDLQGQLTQRDANLTELQEKLTSSQADVDTRLSEAQKAVTDLQAKYEADKQNWESKNAAQAYEFLVREKASTLEFSSAAAKREFIREAIGKGFKVDGETLLGYEEFVSKYKADDPTAFAAEKVEPEQPPKPKPDIVLPGNTTPPPDDKKGFNFSFHGVRPMPESK